MRNDFDRLAMGQGTEKFNHHHSLRLRIHQSIKSVRLSCSSDSNSMRKSVLLHSREENESKFVPQ